MRFSKEETKEHKEFLRVEKQKDKEHIKRNPKKQRKANSNCILV